MAVTLDRGETHCLVRLEGQVNIAAAAELKNVLLQALASGKELRADLGPASDLDVTALQLLLAAEREAQESGTRFVLAGPLPGEIAAGALAAGLASFPISADKNTGEPK